jgi:hypothetical protein
MLHLEVLVEQEVFLVAVLLVEQVYQHETA